MNGNVTMNLLNLGCPLELCCTAANVTMTGIAGLYEMPNSRESQLWSWDLGYGFASIINSAHQRSFAESNGIVGYTVFAFLYMKVS